MILFLFISEPSRIRRPEPAGSSPALFPPRPCQRCTHRPLTIGASRPGAGREGFVAGLDLTTATVGQIGLGFVPMQPCRVVDTREDRGQLRQASPHRRRNSYFCLRSFQWLPDLRSGGRFSLNVTVVPRGPLAYLTIWPGAVTQPFVSTLNSADGRIKANAAIIPGGLGGTFVSVYATNDTDLVIDINGYFATSGLSFYPLPPCRIADTRNPNGVLGGPVLGGGTSREIPVQSSNCGVPANAEAYSLNATVVPSGPLGYLSLWPTGQPQPFVSTLNSPTGAIVANAAIVPAGVNGSVSAYVTNQSHLVLDINGYFAPFGGANGTRYNPLNPCRLLDTRLATGEFGGPVLAGNSQRSYRFPLANCGVPERASAPVLNATVVPSGTLGYLTLWPFGSAAPFVSTLNAFDDTVVSNAAIVPAGTQRRGGQLCHRSNAFDSRHERLLRASLHIRCFAVDFPRARQRVQRRSSGNAGGRPVYMDVAERGFLADGGGFRHWPRFGNDSSGSQSPPVHP